MRLFIIFCLPSQWICCDLSVPDMAHQIAIRWAYVSGIASITNQQNMTCPYDDFQYLMYILIKFSIFLSLYGTCSQQVCDWTNCNEMCICASFPLTGNIPNEGVNHGTAMHS